MSELTQKERRRATAAMTKCPCGNVARLGQTQCGRCEEQSTRAAPLPAGDDGELVGWLRKFGPTAKTTTEQNLMDQAADRIAALNAEVARKDEALVAAQREITALNDALAQAGGSFDA
jgi:hypothetical protein